MVYVWGSNSSHQLAEGTLEKILQPKLAQGFSDAQMVCVGLCYSSVMKTQITGSCYEAYISSNRDSMRRKRKTTRRKIL